MIAALAGFVAGSVHVLAGPDHLAAVAPLAARGGRAAWRSGFRWGFGHAGGVAIVGVAALLLRGLLPIDRLSSWSERLVGVVLIAIGLWGIRAALRTRVHAHPHAHDGHEHAHMHVHGRRLAHADEDAHVHTHAALAVGILHGLAGSSHFLGVLPALALPTHAAAFGYIAAFGAGTIAAMTVFASLVGLVSARSSTRTAGAYRAWLGACSVAAVAIGVVWLV